MKRMFLYLVQLTEAEMDSLLCTEYRYNAIVRSDTPAKARKLLHDEGCIDEDPEAWLDPRRAKLRKLGECTPGTNQGLAIVMSEDNAW